MLETVSFVRPCEFESDRQILSLPRDLQPKLSIQTLFATAKLERNSLAPPVNHEKSDEAYRSFSGLAQSLLDITPRGAARLKQFYLDRNSVQISEDLIGCSSTSEVFRGRFHGHNVAVKRLRMNIVREETDAKELKDLMTEIDLMCRFLLFGQKPFFSCPCKELISRSNEME